MYILVKSANFDNTLPAEYCFVRAFVYLETF